MANGLYLEGRSAFLRGDISVGSDSFGIVGIDTGSYAVSLTTHRYLADIPAGARKGSATLTNANVVNGAFDADDATITTTATIQAFVIYKSTGSDATSTLIAYIDTVDSGLPAAAGSISVQWDNLDSRIFKLSDGLTAECVTLSFTSDIKTGAYTAALNEQVRYDASGGAFQIDAPGSPSRDDTFGIKNDHDTDTTAITVDGNGSDIEGPSGGAAASSQSIGLQNVSVIWRYDGTEWLIV